MFRNRFTLDEVNTAINIRVHDRLMTTINSCTSHFYAHNVIPKLIPNQRSEFNYIYSNPMHSSCRNFVSTVQYRYIDGNQRMNRNLFLR